MTELDQRGQRLRQFLKSKRIKQNALAQLVGVTPGFVSQVIQGNEDFTARLINNLVSSFPELNINWLLKGEGSMLIADEPPRVVKEDSPMYEEVKSDPFGVVRALLEEHERRIRGLEAEVARLKKKE